jgi:hypothetical protein
MRHRNRKAGRNPKFTLLGDDEFGGRDPREARSHRWTRMRRESEPESNQNQNLKKQQQQQKKKKKKKKDLYLSFSLLDLPDESSLDCLWVRSERAFSALPFFCNMHLTREERERDLSLFCPFGMDKH